MDAIKKKMQAMKVEKDNAMDRSDACEQAAKDAKVRAAKAEEEVAELVKKAQQLEVELDKTKEELMQTTEKLKEKYGQHPQISRIARHRQVPRHIKSSRAEIRAIKDGAKRKDANKRKHTKPGSVPYVSERESHTIHEME